MMTVQPSHSATTTRRPSSLQAVRRHLAIVLVLLFVGLALGWFAGTGQTVSWTSTSRVLINPTVGNPFAPAPSTVRQDELTSLETEAQVAGSEEVLAPVAAANPPMTVEDLERGLAITVPANTQILEMSFTADDADTAQRLAFSIAGSYLDNRDLRSSSVNEERIVRVERETEAVVDDLRAATAAAQRGTEAQRLFQSELASALRNQLVSLRAQRSYLENSEAPAGSVISPASAAVSSGGLTPVLMMVIGALVGVTLGCALALVRERLTGRVRTSRDVEAAGVPVLAASSTAPSWRPFRTHVAEPGDDIARRLRARVLGLVPTPEVVAVAPATSGDPGPAVAETLAASFARAGHRVVLVRTGTEGDVRGLAHVLLHERTRVAELLQPSSDPLLTLLPWGFTDQNRERLSFDTLRGALAPLLNAGHIVVLESPDVTSVEGEAILGAADLGLVVVTIGRTRTRAVAELGARRAGLGTDVVATVVDQQTATTRVDLDPDDSDDFDVPSGKGGKGEKGEKGAKGATPAARSQVVRSTR